MSFGVFLAVLCAAGLHAGWNAAIRSGSDKIEGMLLLSVSQGLMGLVLALFYPLPQGEIWLWLAASLVLHVVYKVFLTFAYQHGDLSRVYPIARGTAPLVVAIVGVVLLADEVSSREYSGIFLVGAGILLMARGVFTGGESRTLLPFALSSAMATAGYTLIDGLGARAAGNASMFVAWLFLLDGAMFASWAYFARGRSVLSATPRAWRLGVVAGGASFAAYWVVVWAMTEAPIALVSALRETSVLFAVMIGIVFFRERADAGKLIAAGLIVAGIVLTRI